LTLGGAGVSSLSYLDAEIDKWCDLILSAIGDYHKWRSAFEAAKEGRAELPFERLHEPTKAGSILEASTILIYHLHRLEIDTSGVKRLSRLLVRWARDPVKYWNKLPPARELGIMCCEVIAELSASVDKLRQSEPLDEATAETPGVGEAQPGAAAQPQANAEPASGPQLQSDEQPTSMGTTQDLEYKLLKVLRVVVGKKPTSGCSRLLEIASSKARVEDKLAAMTKTGLLRPDVSATELAGLLGVSSTAVKNTAWWKNRQVQRKQAAADDLAARIEKHRR
jgi:hypothetical protein